MLNSCSSVTVDPSLALGDEVLTPAPAGPAGRAIDSMFASVAFYEPTEEHMEGAMAVDHLGAPQRAEEWPLRLRPLA